MEHTYPGEDRPLRMRQGGAPVSDEEALGVLRRQTRTANARRAAEKQVPVPDELPREDEPAELVAFRVPRRLMAQVRARADMEGVTVTSVVTTAFQLYADSSPGSRFTTY